jgi:hypothetical protein
MAMVRDGAEIESATRSLLAGEIEFDEYVGTFLNGRVWFKRGDEVGFLAVGPPGNGFIPIYSSELALARGEGECEWASTTGEDVLRLLPRGYDFLLDRGSDTELRLARLEIEGAV